MNPFLVAAVFLALASTIFFIIKIGKTRTIKKLQFKLATCQITEREMVQLQRLTA